MSVDKCLLRLENSGSRFKVPSSAFSGGEEEESEFVEASV